MAVVLRRAGLYRGIDLPARASLFFRTLSHLSPFGAIFAGTLASGHSVLPNDDVISIVGRYASFPLCVMFAQR